MKYRSRYVSEQFKSINRKCLRKNNDKIGNKKSCENKQEKHKRYQEWEWIDTNNREMDNDNNA